MPKNNNYTFYDKTSGRITSTLQRTHYKHPQNSESGVLNLIGDPKTQRVDLNTLTLVPLLNFDDGTLVGGVFSVNVPVGTMAIWYDDVYYVDDGLLEIVIDQHGSHALTLLNPICKNRMLTIENN